jgi:hypothetical protein
MYPREIPGRANILDAFTVISLNSVDRLLEGSISQTREPQ